MTIFMRHLETTNHNTYFNTIKNTEENLSFENTSVQHVLSLDFNHHFDVKTDVAQKDVFRMRKVQERNLVLPYSLRTQQLQDKRKGCVTASFLSLPSTSQQCWGITVKSTVIDNMKVEVEAGRFPLGRRIHPESARWGKTEPVIPHCFEFRTRLDSQQRSSRLTVKSR